MPSICSAPLPELAGSAKTAMILRAQSTSSADGAKTLVAGCDLIWMDQGLAVHAEIAALFAFRAQAFVVVEVVVDAVDDFDAMRPRRRDACGKPSEHGRAAGRQTCARFLGEIVRAHHEYRSRDAGSAAVRAIDRR